MRLYADNAKKESGMVKVFLLPRELVPLRLGFEDKYSISKPTFHR